jgi:hypothetical protein
LGTKIFVWKPIKSNNIECFKGMSYAQGIKSQRVGCQLIELDQKGSEEFWKLLGVKKLDKIILKSDKMGGDDDIYYSKFQKNMNKKSILRIK